MDELFQDKSCTYQSNAPDGDKAGVSNSSFPFVYAAPTASLWRPMGNKRNKNSLFSQRCFSRPFVEFNGLPKREANFSLHSGRLQNLLSLHWWENSKSVNYLRYWESFEKSLGFCSRWISTIKKAIRILPDRFF